MRRYVQRLEVVEVVLDLGPFGDVETELAEHFLDAAHGQRDRMQAAAIDAAPRQGDIDCFAQQLRLDLGLAELRPARFQ